MLFKNLRAMLTTWWAWCLYLTALIVLYESVSVWWVQWPIIIVGTVVYVIFSVIQIFSLVSSGIPLYFGTVSTFADRRYVFKNAIAGYFMIVFDFALFYLIISKSDNAAFNVPLDFASAFYFSMVTMATVGYGDIVPVDASTRLLVCLEIVLGLGFTVLLFAMLANIVVKPRSPLNHRDES